MNLYSVLKQKHQYWMDSGLTSPLWGQTAMLVNPLVFFLTVIMVSDNASGMFPNIIIMVPVVKTPLFNIFMGSDLLDWSMLTAFSACFTK